MRRETPDDGTKLLWHPDAPNHLTIGDTEFNVAAMLSAQSEHRMVIRKNRDMIASIAAVVEELAARNIVELGIDQGAVEGIPAERLEEPSGPWPTGVPLALLVFELVRTQSLPKQTSKPSMLTADGCSVSCALGLAGDKTSRCRYPAAAVRIRPCA